jgi:nitrate/nitrite transporter NarK
VYKAAAKPAGAFVTAKAAAIKAGTAFVAAQYALPAGALHGIMMLFAVSGIVFIIIGGLCAFALKNPPPNYTVAGQSATAPASQSTGYEPSEAMATPQLYGLWILLFLNVTAGILIISNAAPIYSELTGASPAAAGQIYGVLAIFNGLGRFFWGAVSDRIGRALTYTVMYLIQAVVFFSMAHTGGLVAVGIYFAIVLLCYGGGFGVMPSFTADFFGTKYLGQIYGIILTAWGVAGIVGPFIAAKVRDVTGSYAGALVPVAVMLLIASIIPFFVKKPAAQPQRATA